MPTDKPKPTKTRRVTISQVAAKAGVSITAVSRALNHPRGQTRLSQETQNAILLAAQQLRYQPNSSARSLAKGITGNIGVMFPGNNPLLDPVFGQLATSLTQLLQDHHYRMLLIPISDDPSREHDWRSVLEQNQIDGCLVSHGLPPKVADCLLEQQLPTVLMNIDMDIALPRIVADDATGIQKATRHLIHLNHRRIAYFYTPRPNARPSVAIRLEGFLATMKDHGLAEHGTLFMSEAEAFVDKWFAQPDRATAVVCYSHAEAIDLYQYLWKRGLSVPRDLSVVAFNNVYPTEHMTPPLTVMELPFAEIGRLAAERLLHLLDANSPLSDLTQDKALPLPDRTVLPLRLIIRQSAAHLNEPTSNPSPFLNVSP